MVSACRFSVLTACLPARSGHLAQTAASVARARVAIAPLDLEWIVAVDGPGDLDHVGDADTLVTLAVRGGISVARNAALGAAQGDLVVPLDADDVLVVEGLLQAHQTLLDSSMGWVGANRILLGTGQRTSHWHDARIWEPGELASEWSAPFAFHPNSLVARRELVLRCGGWPAIPANEDLFLALMLSEMAAGASIEAVITEYRVWEGQEVSLPGYPATKEAAFHFIDESINAIRRERGRSEVAHPIPGGAHGTAPVQGHA